MDKYSLKEDKQVPKLFVAFSSKICKQITEITSYNQNNLEGLSQWYDYIDWVRKYMSNSVIAQDYTNRYKQGRNGARFIKDLGLNVRYTVLSDCATDVPFVYIFMIDLKLEEYGLKVPFINLEELQDLETNFKIVYLFHIFYPI